MTPSSRNGGSLHYYCNYYSTLPHNSPEVQALIDKQAAKSQTSASLMTLMKTGRGELLEKMSDIAELAILTNTSRSRTTATTATASNNTTGGGGGGRSLGVDPPPGGETYEDSYPLMDGQKSKTMKKSSSQPQQLHDSGSTNSNSSSSSSSNSSSAAASSSEATPLVLLQVASFLRRELPIRFAHRINDLSRVPLLREMQSVQEVRALYITSFLEILSLDKHPPSNSSVEWENKFATILENIYERHSSVLVQMAKGAYELRAAIRDGADGGLKGSSSTHDDNNSSSISSSNQQQQQREAIEFELMESTHAFLDRFYISRIGMRVLIGQYLSLRQPPVENYVGIICGRTSPYEIVKRAIDDAAFMCTRKYGDAPEVIITGRLDMTFPYVPTHLHYIMLELLKNSMRATVEYHGVDADYPPIKVVIADGSDNEDVIIKVSDEGGGIPRSNMKRIWSYLFTTADPEVQEGMVAFNENVDHSIDSPLAGLGYGLPISRSYTRYFGGDLSIMSMEGYGTDCFVYLTRLGNTKEPLL